MLKNKLLSAMGGSEPTDPYFNYTTLLLHGDGTNGAQNNTFVDSSPNNFTITRNGNVTQGSFSPFSKEPGKWGVSFSGGLGGTYLSTPANNALTLGSGDFTLEFNFCLNRKVIAASVVSSMVENGPNAWTFYLGDSLVLYINDTTAGDSWAIASGRVLITSITYGAWYHIALTRSGNVFRAFVNGVQVDSFTGSATINSYNVINVGSFASRTQSIDGVVSNLRLVKGTALYTSNFTPPTAPLTAVAGTSLLCCQDNRFKDNSANNFTLTPYGNVAVTPFSPFANSAAWSAETNGGSGYFQKGSPGNQHYLTAVSGSSFDFGAGNFTVEGFLYIPSTSTADSRPIFSQRDPIGNGMSFRVTPSVVGSNTKFYLDWFYGEGTNVVSTGDIISPYEWVHVAVTRSGSTITLFVNGISSATVSIGSTSIGSSTAPPTIGGRSSSTSEGYLGYISNLRVVKGTALYTANFTPPTAPLTAVANTSLLLNFTNAAIFDNAMMNDLETVGNAQVSTTVKKYGTGAMYFDGSADYLLAPNSQNIEFGGGDFTIEFWIYRVGSSVCYPIEKRSPSAVSGYSVILFNGTQAGFVASFDDATWGVNISDSNALPQNTWAHVAITRSGNVWRLFVDGAQRASTTTAGAITNNAAPVSIGAQSNGSSSLNGYIDDLRITKGVARYTANFTPPAQAFPNK